jgi:chaperonin GroES
MKTIKPVGNNVVLELETDKVEKMVGLIMIPEKYRDKAVTAKVVAVGPGGKKGHNGKPVKIEINVGDRVYTAKYGGDDIEVDGKTLKLVSYEYVFGVLAS